MKNKDKKEKTSAIEAEEVQVDKTLGIEVELEKPEAAEQNSEQAPEMELLKKQLDESQNRYIRMQADFDNYKKRTAKEKEEFYFLSLEKIVKEILPIVDNMERAVESFKKNGLDSSYVDGVDMIQKQLFAILEKNGLKEIDAMGMDFDPNIHHAVMQVEGDAAEENKVKAVLQKGYYLGSRVIRPAMVQVVVSN